MLTFCVEDHLDGLGLRLCTHDVATGETVTVAYLVSEDARRSFWDVLSGSLLVAREQGRSGL